MIQSSCPPPTAAITTSIAAATATVMDPKLLNTHCDLSFYNISPHRENGVNHLDSMRISGEDDHNNCVESQTLQLFPLRSGGDGSHNINQKETEISVSAMNVNLTPSQFFEFLPLKN